MTSRQRLIDGFPLDVALLVFGDISDFVRFDGGYLSRDDQVVLIERLCGRTERSGDCWIWTGYAKNGYGVISWRNRDRYNHRLAHAITTGSEAGKKMDVRHSCDTPRCWYPGHLQEGTRQENVGDCWERGRAVPPPRITGIRHAKATLAFAQCNEIRTAWVMGGINQRALASMYSVSQSTIWRIINGNTRRTA